MHKIKIQPETFKRVQKHFHHLASTLKFCGDDGMIEIELDNNTLGHLIDEAEDHEIVSNDPFVCDYDSVLNRILDGKDEPTDPHNHN